MATAFLHRDSRAGDPDLHTDVAVVQTREGKWLSIYGRVLHQHVVAASETYNTTLEHHLSGPSASSSPSEHPLHATSGRCGDRRHRTRPLPAGGPGGSRS